MKTVVIAMIVCLATASLSAQKTRPRTKSSPSKRTVVPAGLMKAEEAIGKKDYAAAEPLLWEETKSNPQDFRAWYDLGFVYQETNRADQAVNAFKRSIAIDPTNAETFAALGRLELTLGRREDALDHLGKAAALKPSPATWIAIAVAHGDNPDEALPALAKASALAPTDPEPRLRAGSIYEQRKDWPNAEREYLAAQKLGDKGESLTGLINVYQQTHRPEEAIGSLREYLQQDPNDARAHVQLGRLLAAKGDKESAAREFEIASGLPGNDTQVVIQVADELAELHEYNKAIPLLRRALENEPRHAGLHQRLANWLNATSDFAAAEPEFIRALELDPKLTDAYGGLAIAASKNNHHQLAIKALDARTKLAPDNPGTYFLRATSYDNLQQYPSAAENYHRFLEVAQGAYPDQEWQARHRLMAIEPESKKKR